MGFARKALLITLAATFATSAFAKTPRRTEQQPPAPEAAPEATVQTPERLNLPLNNAQSEALITDYGRAFHRAFTEILHGSKNPEVKWVDPQGRVGGSLTVAGRYYDQQSKQYCSELIHSVVDGANRPIISDRRHGQQLAFKNTFCYDSTTKSFVKFEGDRANLIAQTGVEHRREFPHAVSPVYMTSAVAFFKSWNQTIRTAQRDEWVVSYTADAIKATQKLVETLQANSQTITLDQVAILLKELELEDVRLGVLQALKPVLEKGAGDANEIMSQFPTKATEATAALN